VTESYKSSISPAKLLIGVHPSRKRSRRNVIFNRPFDWGHRDVWNTLVIQTTLQLVLFWTIWH